MTTEIPEWILKYDSQNYQSSAGKAIRELISIIKTAETNGYNKGIQKAWNLIDYMVDTQILDNHPYPALKAKFEALKVNP